MHKLGSSNDTHTTKSGTATTTATTKLSVATTAFLCREVESIAIFITHGIFLMTNYFLSTRLSTNHSSFCYSYFAAAATLTYKILPTLIHHNHVEAINEIIACFYYDPVHFQPTSNLQHFHYLLNEAQQIIGN